MIYKGDALNYIQYVKNRKLSYHSIISNSIARDGSDIRFFFSLSPSGKGDLVGCDISQHLLNCSSGQGGSNQHGTTGSQDVIVKSSSDVKVHPTSIKTHHFLIFYCSARRIYVH